MKKMMLAYPPLLEAFANVGEDLLQQLIHTLRSKPIGRVALGLEVDKILDDLGYRQASPLERMSSLEVLAAWLTHQKAQQQFLEFTSGSTNLQKQRLWISV